MKITQNKDKPHLFSLDVTMNNKRIRRRNLTKKQLDRMLKELQVSQYEKVNYFTWRKAFNLCKEHRWSHNASNYAEKHAFEILTATDAWGLDPNETEVLDFYHYVNTLNLKGQSKNKRLNSIRTILTVAAQHGKLTTNKLMPSFITQEPKERDTFSSEDMERIRAWYEENTDIETLAYWDSLAYLGCRPIELERMLWKDVTKDSVTLRSKKTKDGHTRKRTLPKPPIPWFLDRGESNDKVFPNYCRFRLHKLFKKMRIETGLNKEGKNLVQYSARHTKITNLMAKNHHVTKVQAWAGHSDIKTTMNYTKSIKNDLMELA